MYSNYGIKKINITRFIIAGTGTYGDQVLRPYSASINHTQVRRIHERIEGASAITPSMLSGISTEVMMPSVRPEGIVHIENGWGQNRLRFLLELRIEDMIGNYLTERVTGWTDYPGVAGTDHIDPKMTFHISNINLLRSQQHVTPTGMQTSSKLIESSHVLTNSKHISHNAPGQAWSMRPEDIYTEIDSLQLNDGIDNESMVIDTRSMITKNARKSKRTNTVAPIYMSGIMNSYLQSSRSSQYESPAEVMESARQTVASGSVRDDAFLAFLADTNGMHATSYFTYNDLLKLDNNVNVIKSVIAGGRMQQLQGASWSDVADWNGRDSTTLAASTITQAMPGYMLDLELNNVSITAHNDLVGGGMFVGFDTPPGSFNNNMDLSGKMQAFCFRLETELFKAISQNNAILLRVNVQCDLQSDTMIKISLNNEEMATYVTPAFCDSLMPPVITSNRQTFMDLASDLGQLLDTVGDFNPTNESAVASIPDYSSRF